MIIKIGHRGAKGYAPENTIKSFKTALDLKVDMIELDVHICRSGEVVVIHDSRVDRTTNGTGYTAEKSLNELKKLNAGDGEKIPLLSEALEFIDKQARVNIELKGENTALPVHHLIEKFVNEKGWKYHHFLISSFDHYELKRFNKLNPHVEIGAILQGIPIGFAEFAEKVNAQYVNLSSEFINQNFVKDAHNRGLKVLAWTGNDFEDIRRLKKLGVDGIFSDFPDRL